MQQRKTIPGLTRKISRLILFKSSVAAPFRNQGLLCPHQPSLQFPLTHPSHPLLLQPLLRSPPCQTLLPRLHHPPYQPNRLTPNQALPNNISRSLTRPRRSEEHTSEL